MSEIATFDISPELLERETAPIIYIGEVACDITKPDLPQAVNPAVCPVNGFGGCVGNDHECAGGCKLLNAPPPQPTPEPKRD